MNGPNTPINKPRQRVEIFEEADLKAENERLRKALEDIIVYQEEMAGALHKKTAVWNIAYKALKGI